jgi:hypothetical protein
MASKANPRNHRNNPYALDVFAAQVHHSAAGTLFRFRTEISILLMGLGAFLALARTASRLWALVILAGLILAVFVLPWTRRFMIRRAWCVISRHRLQRVFFETRMHTRSGRLSLILWIRPTQVGERAFVWCRAGICAEDLEAHTGEIAAALRPRNPRRQIGTLGAAGHRRHRAPRHPRPAHRRPIRPRTHSAAGHR